MTAGWSSHQVFSTRADCEQAIRETQSLRLHFACVEAGTLLTPLAEFAVEPVALP